MSLQDGSMVKELSTERGSAGIEMVLWSLMLLVFIALPLICAIFEVYTYTLYGVKWSAATENVLDQVEWQMQTESLSECGRDLFLEKTRVMLASEFDALSASNQGEHWNIETLAVIEEDPPQLNIELIVEYDPVTMVGAFISNKDHLEIRLVRQREFPIDR